MFPAETFDKCRDSVFQSAVPELDLELGLQNSLLEYAQVRVGDTLLGIYTELGTFSIFECFNNKKWFFCIFYQVNNLFLHQSYLKKPTPSQMNSIKNAKNHFNCWKNSKNTESAQLWAHLIPCTN